MLRAVPVGLIAALVICMPSPGIAQDLTVFAAASLTSAYERVGALYRQKSGRSVRFSFASSSALAKQIDAGAPASIFAAADDQWMDWAEQRRLIAPGTRRALLSNALVLVTAADRPLNVELKPGFDLAALLGPTGRLVTGDPAHVPVGRYAQQALTALGVWSIAEPRLARADNVRAALVLVERGEAPLGIVYSSDAAVSAKVRVAGKFPAGSHAPITYPVAVVAKHDSPAARAFADFLHGEEAIAVYRKYGFVIKGAQ